jgi:hypothetical protein
MSNNKAGGGGSCLSEIQRLQRVKHLERESLLGNLSVKLYRKEMNGGGIWSK